MCVRVRTRPERRRRRDRRIPIRPQSSPRQTYSAGRSTTTAQPHSPTTRPPPCIPRQLCPPFGIGRYNIIVVINRYSGRYSGFPFLPSRRFAGVFRSRLTEIVSYASGLWQIGVSIAAGYDSRRLRRIVATPDTTRLQSGKSPKRRNDNVSSDDNIVLRN